MTAESIVEQQAAVHDKIEKARRRQLAARQLADKASARIRGLEIHRILNTDAVYAELESVEKEQRHAIHQARLRMSKKIEGMTTIAANLVELLAACDADVKAERVAIKKLDEVKTTRHTLVVAATVKVCGRDQSVL